MKITVFTSNQPRHIALVETLCSATDDVFAVHECNTVFPGEVADVHRATPVMRDYMSRVTAAERDVFGRVRMLPAGVRAMPLRMGDLSRLPLDAFGDALDADVFVVFGSSLIKGPLLPHLVDRNAINIHIGVSPYYRGSACNFWALYDGRPDLVGATVHLLSAGIDSGAMLRHALPPAAAVDPFQLGMLAVRAGHEAALASIRAGEQRTPQRVVQDRSLELRYSTRAEFTDDIASDYLSRVPTPESIARSLANRDLSSFVRPHIGNLKLPPT